MNKFFVDDRTCISAGKIVAVENVTWFFGRSASTRNDVGIGGLTIGQRRRTYADVTWILYIINNLATNAINKCGYNCEVTYWSSSKDITSFT